MTRSVAHGSPETVLLFDEQAGTRPGACKGRLFAACARSGKLVAERVASRVRGKRKQASPSLP